MQRVRSAFWRMGEGKEGHPNDSGSPAGQSMEPVFIEYKRHIQALMSSIIEYVGHTETCDMRATEQLY